MDFETVSAEEFGKSLTGIGINLLVRDVLAECAFLETIFGMGIHRSSADFAIVTYGDQVFQLHGDGTYSSHPLLGLLPEQPPRGAGAQFHLFETDPDDAASKAESFGAMILQPPTDKPHGLREAFILCENGYVWVPSARL